MDYSLKLKRFISSYIIVLFTVQRLLMIYKPFGNNLKSKRSAWLAVIIILIISLIVNLWSLFMFEVDSFKKQCDVKTSIKSEYFVLTNLYSCIVILMPTLVIFTGN